MSRVRSSDTKPELLIRGLLHRLGYRYRVSPRELPGKPDLAFTRRRAAIFVTAASGTGTIANAALVLPRPTQITGPQRSPATGSATSACRRSSARSAGRFSFFGNANWAKGRNWRAGWLNSWARRAQL